jgi:ERCC4-related helicase
MESGKRTCSARYTSILHSPTDKMHCIKFRLYQNNIYESAKSKNTLVILPTALGKTIIAILVSAEFLYYYRSRRILIMAPTKPLVAQHMCSFFSVLNIPEDGIAVVTGKNLPPTRTAIWNQKEIRLVFATPEVVKNDIVENRLSPSEFSLLVFLMRFFLIRLIGL